MELSTILLAVAALACPIGMGVMMWMMMNKNMDGQHGRSQANQTDADRLQTLLTQRRQLEQEIAEAEKIAALNAKKEALAETQTPLIES